jgi:hypothetical protein
MGELRMSRRFKQRSQAYRAYLDAQRTPSKEDYAQALRECPDNMTQAAQRAIELMYRRQDTERNANS